MAKLFTKLKMGNADGSYIREISGIELKGESLRKTRVKKEIETLN